RTRLQVIGIAEILLRHALREIVAALAVRLGRRHIDQELLAGLAAHQRFFEARDQTALADQERERLAAIMRRLDFLAAFADRVVEDDDLVFFDFHGVLQARRASLAARRGSVMPRPGRRACRTRRRAPRVRTRSRARETLRRSR